jgi:hypothetical protein
MVFFRWFWEISKPSKEISKPSKEISKPSKEKKTHLLLVDSLKTPQLVANQLIVNF